jgi:hypothetical protein
VAGGGPYGLPLIMHRFYIRIISVTVLLFTAVLVLIHAQPYDDHELRQVLQPEGCPAPCFMGIRPGVTTLDEAIQILEASGWVEQYHYQPSSASLSIKWNHKTPAWLANDDLYGGSALWLLDGVVVQIGLQTNILLGDIKLYEGQVRYQLISRTFVDGRNILFYDAGYPDKSLSMSITHDCTQRADNIGYFDKVLLSFAQFASDYDFPSMHNHRSWLDVIRTSCP